MSVVIGECGDETPAIVMTLAIVWSGDGPNTVIVLRFGTAIACNLDERNPLKGQECVWGGDYSNQLTG